MTAIASAIPRPKLASLKAPSWQHQRRLPHSKTSVSSISPRQARSLYTHRTAAADADGGGVCYVHWIPTIDLVFSQ